MSIARFVIELVLKAIRHIKFVWGHLVLFLKSKKKWQRLKKRPVLIFDTCESYVFDPYLNPDDVAELPVRGEYINAPAYIVYILKLLLRRHQFTFHEYVVRTINPLVLLTFIDNNLEFLHLNLRDTKIKKVAVQNGLRAENGRIFELLKTNIAAGASYYVDYMLVFGDGIGQEYNKYVPGHYISIGSFKNNSIKRNSVQKDPGKTLIYISQFRPRSESGISFYAGETPVTWEEFYNAEKVLLKNLYGYACHHGIPLQVLGTSRDALEQEIDFYKQCIESTDWEYVPRKDVMSNYKMIDKAHAIVAINSTLAYEAFVRGTRVAMFAIRSFAGLDSPHPFGWPCKFADTGSFWTNHFSEQKMKDILEFVFNATDEQWNQELQRVDPQVITYDADNGTFVNLMQELGIHAEPGIQAS